MLLALVLAVAIGNLALGYLAAAALADPPVWTRIRLRMPRAAWPRRAVNTTPAAPHAEHAKPSVETIQTTREAVVVKRPATIVGVEELPGEWLDKLAAAGIVPQSFVEGAVQVLRLEIETYRDSLVALELRARGLPGPGDMQALTGLANELEDLNQSWLQAQTSATGTLSARAGQLGEHEDSAGALEHALLDQAAEIRGASQALAELGRALDVTLASKTLLEQFAVLIDQTHTLRDRMLELLANLLRTGERLDAIAPASHTDPATDLPNRTGLEVQLARWWREDAERSRLLSVILVDIDRLGRLNQRLGTALGDEVLVAISQLFLEMARANRTSNWMARVEGQAFLIVLEDAGPREALTTAERLRQTVEATTFEDNRGEFELTVCCGVIEVGARESTAELLRRVKEAALFAKKAGRNRCALDEGQGPSTLQPPQFPVQGRVLKLGSL